MKTFICYLIIALSFYNCSQPVKTKEKAVPSTLEGTWVIRQQFSSDNLVLLNHDTYKPEVFPAYNYIVFDKEKKTILTHSVGEFGLAEGVSSTLDLSEVHWTINNDQLHISGRYRDYSGLHSLDNVYTVERKGDTLCLKRSVSGKAIAKSN